MSKIKYLFGVFAGFVIFGSSAFAVSLNTPEELEVEAQGAKVVLSWSNSADERIGYEIVRIQLSNHESKTTRIADTKDNQFIDTTAVPETTYVYTIKSYSDQTYSGSSNAAVVTTSKENAEVKVAPLAPKPYDIPEPKKEEKVKAKPAPEASDIDATPASPAPLFQSYKVLTGMKLIAPLSDLMNMDRTIPEGQPQPSVEGRLEFADGTVFPSVTIAMRGNSSKRMDQCSFVKLNLKINTPTENTILNGIKKFKIGTHCGESEYPAPVWNRVINQKSPIREALIYRILNIAGAVTFRSRTAVVTYQDTSAKTRTAFFPEGRTLVRSAMLLEDEKYAAKRYGGEISIKSGKSAGVAKMPSVSSETAVLGLFGEILTRNYDYYLISYDKSYLWNINVIVDKNQAKHIQVYDWDISPFVKAADGGYGSSEKAMSQMHELPNVHAADFEKGKEKYLKSKSKIYEAVSDNFSGPFSGDTAGKQNIINHLNSFYDWLTTASF